MKSTIDWTVRCIYHLIMPQHHYLCERLRANNKWTHDGNWLVRIKSIESSDCLIISSNRHPNDGCTTIEMTKQLKIFRFSIESLISVIESTTESRLEMTCDNSHHPTCQAICQVTCHSTLDLKVGSNFGTIRSASPDLVSASPTYSQSSQL